MRDLATIPDAPPADLRFRRGISVVRSLREVWASRDLVATLVEREFRVRYKQAALGAAWALAQPVALVLAFTLFKRGSHIETGHVAYAVWAFLGLLPWSLFSAGLSQGGVSLLNNVALINKVYCPREVFPVSMVGVACGDTLVAVLGLAGLMVVTGTVPQWTSFYLVPLFAVQLVFTLAATLAISAIVVHVRDIRHVLPVVLPVGLFINPIAIPLDRLVPAHERLVYSIFNPLGPVIDDYRRVVLFGQAPDWHLLIPAAISSVVLFLLATHLFRRLEVGFADLV